MGLTADLAGRRARIDLNTRYFANGNEVLDINHVVRQRGRDTRAQILESGVLDGAAKKSLRATIDLVHGGRGSKGSETESVLMHKAGFVESQRGKGGGYRLTRKPEEYRIGELLRAAEGNLAPVQCLSCTNDDLCPRIDTCTTIGVWRDLGKVTSAFLDSKTLADLVREPDTAK